VPNQSHPRPENENDFPSKFGDKNGSRMTIKLQATGFVLEEGQKKKHESPALKQKANDSRCVASSGFRSRLQSDSQCTILAQSRECIRRLREHDS